MTILHDNPPEFEYPKKLDFEIVTAVTPDQLKRLRWSLPTWTIKPQFKGKQLHIFHSGFKDVEKALGWVNDYFPGAICHEWDMPGDIDQRELMLSCFVLGSGQVVQSSHFVKLDNDCYFHTPQDVFEESDLNYSLVAHPWGYTRPAWFHEYMEAWCDGDAYEGHTVFRKGDISTSTYPNEETDLREKISHKRIISWCCLHQTDFVRKCAEQAGERLPVPSHDSYLWYMAERWPEFSWHSKNLKALGVDHVSRFKGLREGICAHDMAWNQPLNNIQLEITSQCNMACPNCDRNCGTAKTDEQMTLRQIYKFVHESVFDRDEAWSRIDIIGGEPTLHPDLMEIIEALEGMPGKIRLTTNGSNPDIIAKLPKRVQVRDSAKEKKQPKFEAVNMAPVDLGLDITQHKRKPDDREAADLGLVQYSYQVHGVQMCSIPWRCGLALTRSGYYLCGAGASVARVFGLDIGIKKLEDVTVENLQAQRAVLCRLCGHSRSMPKDLREVTEQKTSPLWAEAFKTYKDKELSLY